ncbi:putative tyrosyl-trna mitochondrial precursor [Erysiphe necator]|uniref:Tyrosine--tRNA ligase n=1 Tax=Uncinula necator TaxID=52586 RepID=A0A0B1PES2_UNCNE|nr:putative tyrosyl-trna mitochondrial precursor [Erysiphe necator]
MVLQPITQWSIGRAFNTCTERWIRRKNAGVWIAKRWIGMKYLAKVAAAEDEWQQKSLRIRAGKEKDMLTILEERGLVNQAVGDMSNLRETLISRRVGVYVGVDPTAASLHIGNLVPLMALFWMYLEGYHTVSLLGGATAKVGDPTDRLSSRKKEKPAVRAANMTSMHLQLKRLWVNVEASGRKYGFTRTWANHRELVNNSTWWNKTSILEVLQILGPGMRLGTMLARETVKQKMRKGDGMSYAEFSYPILQAWDWWYMFHSKGIQLQLGGSDQFGNILTGIDAIKYILATHPDPDFRSKAKHVGEPLGLTVPLFTTSSGEKFGKTAGNAIWLDSDLMSSFDLYGYFLRVSDMDVKKYLKMFTFIPLPEIESLVDEHFKEPPKRLAQHRLAQEFVELVHGFQLANEAKEQHNLLFQKNSSPLQLATTDSTKSDHSMKQTTVNNRPKVNLKLPESLIYQRMFGKVVFAAGFASSLSEGRRLLNASGIYIGTMPDRSTNFDSGHVTWSKVEADSEAPYLRKYLANGELIILRKGKHNVRIIQIISDEEFVKAGLKYPGMSEEWKESVLEAIKVQESGISNEKKHYKEVGDIGDLLSEDEELTRLNK